MNIIEFLTGPAGQSTMAGGFGGAVRWMTLRSDWKTGLIGLGVGGISSVYASPFVRPLLGPMMNAVTSDIAQQANFSGFVVGIGGITITGLIMDIITARRKKADANSDPKSN